MGLMRELSNKDKSRLIGDVVLLAAASKTHRGFPVADVVEILLPPVDLNQFRIYHDQNNRPIGLVTWAWMTQAVYDRYRAGRVVLGANEWSGGDLLVMTDFIAPYGHAKGIIQDLRGNIFPDETAYVLRFDAAGKPRIKAHEWRGVNVGKVN